VARYDKYEPYAGGFRAPLAADWSKDDLSTAFGVGLNANGQVVKGAGNTGVLGILILTKAYKAGHVIDVQTDGEVVEFGGTAGTVYFADATTGVISTTNTGTRVGHTVEGGRLITRVTPLAVAAEGGV